MFQDSLHFAEIHGMRLNHPELGVIDISEWSLATEDTATELFAYATENIGGKVPHVLVGHPEFDRDHEDVIGRQIRTLERANFLDHSPLKKPYDASTVFKVPCKPV